MNKIFSLIILLSVFTTLYSQDTFKGEFINMDLKIKMSLNLYEDIIPVPGLEIENCYGYFQGNINGLWIILKVIKIKGDVAEVRAVSERGSDAQNFRFTKKGDDIEIKQIDGSAMKGISNRKYVKLPKTILMKSAK